MTPILEIERATVGKRCNACHAEQAVVVMRVEHDGDEVACAGWCPRCAVELTSVILMTAQRGPMKRDEGS